MIDELLRKQKKSLLNYFSGVSIEKTSKIVEKLHACTGAIYLSGVGKSGFIAQKIASTLCSIGKKAVFLCPLNALHGDIGSIGDQDVVLLFSKSGESAELLELIVHLHARGAYTIAISCDESSKLAKEAKQSIALPLDQELCTYNLAPTTSAALQLLFGDVICMALMEKKELSESEYHKNHPAGAIGKKASLRVKDVMLQGGDLPLLTDKASIKDAILYLSQSRKGCVLIQNAERKLVGILTDGDIRKILSERGGDALDEGVSAYMTRNFIALSEDIMAWDALKEMQKDPTKWVTIAPVMREGLLLGLLRMHDVVKQGIR